MSRASMRCRDQNACRSPFRAGDRSVPDWKDKVKKVADELRWRSCQGSCRVIEDRGPGPRAADSVVQKKQRLVRRAEDILSDMVIATARLSAHARIVSNNCGSGTNQGRDVGPEF